MRLLRALARLALFQAHSPAARPFITAEPTAVPAVSWIQCHLLASHDFGVRCEPGRIFLACRRCGARSRGLVFDEIPYASRPRTAAAVAVRSATLDARSEAIRTSHAPAVPGPAVAPAAPPAPRAWRAVRVGGRAFRDIHRLTGALVVSGPAVNLGAWVLAAPARVRVHAARDPPIAAFSPIGVAGGSRRPAAAGTPFFATANRPPAGRMCHATGRGRKSLLP